MYAMSIAVADYGIRPKLLDSMMVSDVGSPQEGWPWIDALPKDRGCDPSLVTQKDPEYNLPTFLHYCQTYIVKDFQDGFLKNPGNEPNYKYSKYQVPNDILQCPEGSKALEGGESKSKKSNNNKNTAVMLLNEKTGLLPEPPIHVNSYNKVMELRNIFMNCVATRSTNQAAKDFRKWFCEVSHE